MSPLYHCRRRRRQRQRLSLKYDLRSASCAHLRKSLPFSAPKMMQKSCKIVTEIDPESMQNRPPKDQNDSQIWPWGAQTTQEGLQEPLGTLLGVSVALLGGPWAPPGEPWDASWVHKGRQREPPDTPKSKKSTPKRLPRPKSRPTWVGNHFRHDFRMIFHRFGYRNR